MINYIRGVLIEKHPTNVVLEVGGIGYDIAIPLSTYSLLPERECEVTLRVYVHIREDAWSFFGFATQEEKDTFILLISISGIGPKVALTILSGIGIKAFEQAISQQDVGALTAISGIGKKTAERMIVELKEKVKTPEVGLAHQDREDVLVEEGVASDSIIALLSLGYKRTQAEAAVRKAFAKGMQDASLEEIIRQALTYV